MGQWQSPRQYEAAKKRADPNNKLVEELLHMRRETVPVVRQAVSEGHAYLLINNRSEGNAPFPVQGLPEVPTPS